MRLLQPFVRLYLRVRRLPARWLVPLLGVTAIALAVGGVFMYRTYDYVQHDNEFCLTCHLMVDPYERFAQSAHRGLGCKACHRPTPVARAQMGLSQIIHNPDSLTVHAEVPNEICAECHIEGDPEKWRIVASSAGHRIHLESDDPELAGLNCVECHSSSVHEFAATSRTCGQSGCHENTSIKLGRMGDLTIHCVACHDFSQPIAEHVPIDSVRLALRPEQTDCLSCHAMRTLVSDLPEDDPHNGACGACHNPHEQETPRAAVASCAASGCHTNPDSASPMHRGLTAGRIADCVSCHRAHDFSLEGVACLDCHRDIFDRPATTIAARYDGSAPVVRLAGTASARPPASRFVHAARSPSRSPAVQVPFSHGQHRTQSCESCHDSRDRHGALIVTTAAACQRCHHTGPPSANCTACHTQSEIATVQREPMLFRVSAGERQSTRAISFEHARHTGIQCVQCHTEPLTRATTVSCTSCHQQHHELDRQCMICHVEPREGAHDRRVHVGCAGAGCHTRMPFQGVPRTRPFCLACHQDMVRHEPGGVCADCHAMPAPRR